MPTATLSADGTTITVAITDAGGGTGDGTGFTLTIPNNPDNNTPTVTAAVASGTTLTLTIDPPVVFWYASQFGTAPTVSYDGSGVPNVSAFGPDDVDTSARPQHKPAITAVPLASTQSLVIITTHASTLGVSYNLFLSGVNTSTESPFVVSGSTYETASEHFAAVAEGTYDATIAFGGQPDAFLSDPVSVTLMNGPPFGASSTITVYQNGTPITLTWNARDLAWEDGDSNALGLYSWTWFWGAEAGGIAFDGSTFVFDVEPSGNEFARLVSFSGGVPSFISRGVWNGQWKNVGSGGGWAEDTSVPPTGFLPLADVGSFSASTNLTITGTTVTMLLSETAPAYSAVNSGSNFTFTGISDPSALTLTIAEGGSALIISGTGLDAATDVSYDGGLTIPDADANNLVNFSALPLVAGGGGGGASSAAITSGAAHALGIMGFFDTPIKRS